MIQTQANGKNRWRIKADVNTQYNPGRDIDCKR